MAVGPFKDFVDSNGTAFRVEEVPVAGPVPYHLWEECPDPFPPATEVGWVRRSDLDEADDRRLRAVVQFFLGALWATLP